MAAAFSAVGHTLVSQDDRVMNHRRHGLLVPSKDRNIPGPQGIDLPETVGCVSQGVPGVCNSLVCSTPMRESSTTPWDRSGSASSGVAGATSGTTSLDGTSAAVGEELRPLPQFDRHGLDSGSGTMIVLTSVRQREARRPRGRARAQHPETATCCCGVASRKAVGLSLFWTWSCGLPLGCAVAGTRATGPHGDADGGGLAALTPTGGAVATQVRGGRR